MLPCKDEKESEREGGSSAGTCSGTSGNFLMSENVADIRPTALGKWDEQLVKNTIEFYLLPPSLSPTAPEKRGKKLISNFGLSLADEVKF